MYIIFVDCMCSAYVCLYVGMYMCMYIFSVYVLHITWICSMWSKYVCFVYCLTYEPFKFPVLPAYVWYVFRVCLAGKPSQNHHLVSWYSPFLPLVFLLNLSPFSLPVYSSSFYLPCFPPPFLPSHFLLHLFLLFLVLFYMYVY